MRLNLLPNGDLSFTNLHPLEASALLAIPQHADPTDVPGMADRLYPALTGDAVEAAHDPVETSRDQEDWEDYVVPELQELFAGSLAKVMAGLKRLGPAPYETDDDDDDDDDAEEENAAETSPVPNFALTVVREDAEDWFRAMNQARLVMTQKSLWIEDDGQLHGPFLDQIHYEIYTGIQEWLVLNVLGKGNL